MPSAWLFWLFLLVAAPYCREETGESVELDSWEWDTTCVERPCRYTEEGGSVPIEEPSFTMRPGHAYVVTVKGVGPDSTFDLTDVTGGFCTPEIAEKSREHQAYLWALGVRVVEVPE